MAWVALKAVLPKRSAQEQDSGRVSHNRLNMKAPEVLCGELAASQDWEQKKPRTGLQESLKGT